MLKYATDRNNDILRRALWEHNASKVELENTIIDSAVAYFDRTGDHEALRDALKERFAVGITKTTSIAEDGTASDTGYETYSKSAKKLQIDSGIIEAVTSGIGGKITSALANMFTAQNQSWEFVTENEDGSKEPAEDAEALIKEHRAAGGFSTALVNTDLLACSINGAYMLVTWVGGHLQYHVVNPTSFSAIFHEDILDNGERRAVDYSQIEDATVVVIRLSGSLNAAPDKQQYLAMFGRSKEHEYGRHVTYRASKWDNIPDVGRGGVEYVIPPGFDGAGQIANPMSWLAAQDTSVIVPEYPIISLSGGQAKTGQGLLTLTTSLFDNCVEIDIAYSRLLKDSLNAARGIEVLRNPGGEPLPRCLEGPISLIGEQTLEIMGQSASNAQAAMSVVESTVTSVGGGYNVPDYLLVSDPISLAASSGVALFIRTKQLIDFRGYRILANRPKIRRLFDVEKCLLSAHAPEQGAILDGVAQVWNPGTYMIPEDEALKTARLAAATQAGHIDYVRAVREANGFSTDREAESFIEMMEERKAAFPGPQAAAPKRGAAPVGITRQPPNGAK